MRIRHIIYIFSAVWAIAAYFFLSSAIETEVLFNIRLAQTYAFTALSFLYLTLLASPLTHVFPNINFKDKYIEARPALGYSTLFFALLHAGIAFFILLGGFSGLGFLGKNYFVAIIPSAAALAIFLIMALANWFYGKLGSYWKLIHRFSYVAGLLILFHALKIGSHFTDLSKPAPLITFALFFIILILDAIRFDDYLQSLGFGFKRFGLVLIAVLCGAAFSLAYYYPKSGANSALLNIHASHTGGSNSASAGIYSVNFSYPENITAGRESELKFKVTDVLTGRIVTAFEILHEKKMHLIIVNNELNYFSHIHPEFNGTEFVAKTSFPKNDSYRAYLDFQPKGGYEEVRAFTLNIGGGSLKIPQKNSDISKEKKFEGFNVSLDNEGSEIIFNIRYAQTGEPVRNLAPYLGALGHVVMIHKDTYEYVHVHPMALRGSGPEVRFSPLAIGYEPLRKGEYKIFAQFNPGGKLITADFSIVIQ